MALSNKTFVAFFISSGFSISRMDLFLSSLRFSLRALRFCVGKNVARKAAENAKDEK
jgi:hypothetical protein